MNINDELSFKDSHGEKHGLHGHVCLDDTYFTVDPV